MATINNNWVSDYYKKRPQLKRPHFGMFGYDIPPEWAPVVEKLLELVGSASQPKNSADSSNSGSLEGNYHIEYVEMDIVHLRKCR